MFPRWRAITSRQSPIVANTSHHSWRMTPTPIGSRTIPTIDASDAFFVSFETANQITARARITSGDRTMKTPAPVATPLPPRNLVQTGKTCPTIAAAPSTYPAARPSMRRPAPAATAPFAASSTNTQMPRFHPSTRVTLDAPGLPEPTCRMSTPLARATHIALGNVPTR